MTYDVLDLCCGAGLGADGYAAVGLNLFGVDIADQPSYPYEFRRGDALSILEHRDLSRFGVVHASFPCQIHTTAGHLRTAQGGTSKYGDLLTPGLALLRKAAMRHPKMIYVVENVADNKGEVRKIMAPRPGEHLVMLCGSMFFLPLQRHRLFLSNVPLRQPECRHDRWPPDPVTGKPRPWGVYHVKGDAIPSGGRTARDAEHGRQVMGSHRLLKWDELKEGFPPAYTSHVGADLLRALAERSSA